MKILIYSFTIIILSLLILGCSSNSNSEVEEITKDIDTTFEEVELTIEETEEIFEEEPIIEEEAVQEVEEFVEVEEVAVPLEAACDESVLIKKDVPLLYEDNSVSLTEVGSSFAIIDVGGDMESIDVGDYAELNGIFVQVDETFPRTEEEEESAFITVLCEEPEGLNCGEDIFLTYGETLEYEDHMVTLTDVQSTSCTISVDREEAVLDVSHEVGSSDAQSVGGLEITVSEIFSRTEVEESGITLSFSC